MGRSTVAKRRPVRIRNGKQLLRARKKLREEVRKREELLLLRTQNVAQGVRPYALGKTLAQRLLRPARLLSLVPRLFQGRKNKKSTPQENSAHPADGKKNRLPWLLMTLGALAGLWAAQQGVQGVRQWFEPDDEETPEDDS